MCNLTKDCEYCNVTFYCNNTKRDLKRRFCSKKCSATYNGKHNAGNVCSWKKEKLIDGNYICCRCNIEKPISEFNKNSNKGIGINYSCKECLNEKRKSLNYESVNNGNKLCNKCNELKPVIEFFKNKKLKDGRYGHCKKCENIRKLNILHNNPLVRIRENCRQRIRTLLKLKNICKQNSTFDLIGCSPNELKEHLESKFTDGMAWENYGEWHVDHKTPCANFNLEDINEQYKCFHYSNLQPLWAKDNLKKGSKLL